MDSNLLITGAGVDRTAGIEFPLATTLLPEIAAYTKNEGAQVDKALRELLPGLRFTFSKMVSRAVDAITTRGAASQRIMIERVQKAIQDLPEEKEDVRKHGELIVRLFKKLAAITEKGELDEETIRLIEEVFPDNEDLMDSDSILDIHKLSLSDTFKSVLKRTLKIGLESKNHEVAEALGADLLNIEVLLIEKFLGFYNEKPADIKNYIYISWMLWSFLVHRQRKVIEAFDSTKAKLPFYDTIPNNCHAITLNYTSFLENRIGKDKVIYFHGGLSEYVSMATRELIEIEEDMKNLDPESFIKDQKDNIRFKDEDIRKHRHVIPALIPPLRLKPILSHRYIESWHEASKRVKNAKRIAIVGYSFNNADEHFNDILRRQTSDKEITIVGPGVFSGDFIERMSKVFHVASDNWVSMRTQSLQGKKAGNITLIKAFADEFNVSAFFEKAQP